MGLDPGTANNPAEWYHFIIPPYALLLPLLGLFDLNWVFVGAYTCLPLMAIASLTFPAAIHSGMDLTQVIAAQLVLAVIFLSAHLYYLFVFRNRKKHGK